MILDTRKRRCAVLTRSANAAARLLLRSQAERKAASKEVWGTSAEHSGETQGEASPPLRGFVSSVERSGKRRLATRRNFLLPTF